MEDNPEPELFTITVTAMKLTGRHALKHYLSISDGPKELETLLHKHASFQQALREAQRILGAHGVDRIDVLNDPACEGFRTAYGTSSARSQLEW